MTRPPLRALALAALSLVGCGDDATPTPWRPPSTLSIAAPPGFPPMAVPADNAFNVDKAELGRWLFYDRRLSGNQMQSCGSCHRQSLAFTDGRAHGLGSTGQMHPRSPMGLSNVAYFASFAWANPLVTSLERQALLPLFGESPVELGMAGREDELIARVRADARYQQMFPRAFPGEAMPFSVANVVKAIATFERTLLSADSPYDRYQRGDTAAMSASALRGQQLYFGERMECFHCHGGFAFTDSVTSANDRFAETPFHNTGLYNIDGRGAYPEATRGVMDVTQSPADMGRFKAPTLRNVEVTAPYMHDGSIATLDEAFDHYAAGGRTIASGPNAGDGSRSPLRDGFVHGFTITPQERQDLLAFLRALTDRTFLTDARFADPYGNER